MKPEREAIFYDFGRAIHLGFEEYYRNDKSVAHAIGAIDTYVATNDFTPIDNPKEHRTPELAKAVMLAYDARFRDKEDIQVMEENGEKLLEVTFSFPIDTFITDNCIYDVLYAGKIDMIPRVGKLGVFIWDHKHTSSKKDTWYLKYQYPNDQMAGYIFAENVFLDMKVKGVIINLVHVTTKKIDFDRRIITYSKEQLNEWFQNLHTLTQQIVHAIDEVNFPRYSTGCYSMYGGCMMLQFCNNPSAVREEILATDFVKREWNPLASEESTEDSE